MMRRSLWRTSKRRTPRRGSGRWTTMWRRRERERVGRGGREGVEDEYEEGRTTQDLLFGLP